MRHLLLILLLCSTVQAADEIVAFEPGATTCYAVVREVDGDVWYVSGQVFEAWGTGGRDVTDYDIALTDKTGGMFVGTFDTNISSGTYYIVSHYQVAGAPDDDDPPVWQEYGEWDGTNWYTGPVSQIITDMNDIVTDINDTVVDINDTVDLIKIFTDMLVILDTTVADVNDANDFQLAAGYATWDAYLGMNIMVQDADDSHWETRRVFEYRDTRWVYVDETFSFEPAVGDAVRISGLSYGGMIDEIFSLTRQMLLPVFIQDERPDRVSTIGTTTIRSGQ